MSNLISRIKRHRPLSSHVALRWKVSLGAIAILLFSVLFWFLVRNRDSLDRSAESSVESGGRISTGPIAQSSASQASSSPNPAMQGPVTSSSFQQLNLSQILGLKSPVGVGNRQSAKIATKRLPSESISFVPPYAPMVYELLSATLFENHLIELGILDPDQRLDLPLLRALPAQMPGYGRVTSSFGKRKSPFTKRVVHHNGIDVAVPRGSPVKSTGDGIVTYAGWNGGYGKFLEIDHGFGIVSRYGHNQRLLVEVGDRVSRGQSIALAGSSGRSTGPHIHYEVAIHGEEVDPTLVMFPHARELLAKEEAAFKNAELLAMAEGGHAMDDLTSGIGGEGEMALGGEFEETSPGSQARFLSLPPEKVVFQLGDYRSLELNLIVTLGFALILMATIYTASRPKRMLGLPFIAQKVSRARDGTI